MKKILLFLFVLATLVGCGSAKEELVLTAQAQMRVGETVQIESNLDINLIYSSSNLAIATVDEDGMVYAHSVGVITIEVVNPQKTSMKAQVSIEVLEQDEIGIVSSNGLSLYNHQLTTLQAINLRTEQNIEVVFVTANVQVAIVLDGGVVEAIAEGIVDIIAKDVVSNEELARITITVLGIRTVTLNSIQGIHLYINDTTTILATYDDNDQTATVDLISSNEEVITIEDDVVVAIKEGQAFIYAIDPISEDLLGEIEIHVLGEREFLEIIGRTDLYVEDQIQYQVSSLIGTQELEVVWSVSNEEFATIDQTGLVEALKAGQITIRVALASDSSIYAELVVEIEEFVYDVVIMGAESLTVSESIQLFAMVEPEYVSQNVIWSVNDELIASISNDGILEAIQAGIVVVTATSVQDPLVKKSVTITIYPLPDSIDIIGHSQLGIDSTTKLIAVVYPENSYDGVDWLSDDETIATINEQGIVLGISPGTVLITARSKKTQDVSASIVLTVLEAADVSYAQTKILSINTINSTMEMQGIPQTQYVSTTSIRKLVDGVVEDASINDLYIGMTNVYVKTNLVSNTIDKILIDGEEGFNNIRVGIRNSIGDISVDATLYHDTITIRTEVTTILQTFDEETMFVIPADRILLIRFDANEIVVSMSGEFLLRTNKRIQLVPTNVQSELTVTSITRSVGNPRYAGTLEVSIVGQRLVLVNDVNIEEYLTKVVPSEMPASYHIEALRSQAIAARTYAYMDIYRKTHQAKGYTVDDSVSSQVYNNSNRAASTTAAVYDTKGIVMMNEGVPIQANYYSTSSGLTASGHEVWIVNQTIEPIPYLIGQNLSTDLSGSPIVVNTSSEESMLDFFKLVRFNQPDSWASYHRWRVTFTAEQVRTTLNGHLSTMYQNNPAGFHTKQGSSWVPQSIPTDVGSVTDMYVSQRGTSGVVISLDIETSTGIYRIYNQYNIRFTIRPGTAGAQLQTSTSTGNYTNRSSSILNSGFFAIEAINGSYTFYGGGNGHGVGMSQNGARALGEQGYTYTQILSTYYSSTDFVDITYHYTPLENMREWMND